MLEIPSKVFQHVHVGNCADSLAAYNVSKDKNIYPLNILWSEDPRVQREQRAQVADAILSVQHKLYGRAFTSPRDV